MPTLIEFQNIEKEYRMNEGDDTKETVVTRALQGVSLSINEGEFTAIVGQSGSGKSTLMHILGFLDVPSTGKYFFNGRDTTGFNEDELADIRGTSIGFVFQAFNLLPRTTAIDNVRLPLIYQGVPLAEQKERAAEVLRKVGLQDRLYHKPNELSGGQQQRVAVARALITNPRLILADEPTGNLDSKSSHEIVELFQQLHAEGHTLILVTHDLELSKIARRVVQLRDGQIISDQWNSSTL